MVARAGGYYGEALKGAWGVTHEFRAGRGTGTATLEAMMLQQLADLREEVLYVFFLDLHKAYDALDRSRYLDILEGYGVRPKARKLLQT